MNPKRRIYNKGYYSSLYIVYSVLVVFIIIVRSVLFTIRLRGELFTIRATPLFYYTKKYYLYLSQRNTVYI